MVTPEREKEGHQKRLGGTIPDVPQASKNIYTSGGEFGMLAFCHDYTAKEVFVKSLF